MMTDEVQQYTEIVMSWYSFDMLDWCNDNIPGYGRFVSPSFYFDTGYSWYARNAVTKVGVIFSFARPEDATLFALRWA